MALLILTVLADIKRSKYFTFRWVVQYWRFETDFCYCWIPEKLMH